MNGDILYKRLVEREELKDVPILVVMKVAVAVIKEINDYEEEFIHELI